MAQSFSRANVLITETKQLSLKFYHNDKIVKKMCSN